MSSPRPYPPAMPHGEIEDIFSNIFFVKGTVKMSMGLFTFAFSRNMTIVRQNNDELVLINSLRLDDDGLKELDKLGTVKHVIRLAGYHGMDDPFYKDRYPEATIWAVEDTAYFPEFNAKSNDEYFKPDKVMTNTTKMPLKNSSLIVISTATPKEGLLLLTIPEGSILIAGDALQNWATTDRFFNYPARIMMRLMGFIKPHNVGPGWYSGAKPDKAEVETLLEYKFDHVLPVHGEPVIGQACKKYELAIKALKQY